LSIEASLYFVGGNPYEAGIYPVQSDEKLTRKDFADKLILSTGPRR